MAQFLNGSIAPFPRLLNGIIPLLLNGLMARWLHNYTMAIDERSMMAWLFLT